MSDYVVHFTRDTEDRSAYGAQMGILGSGNVRARSRFGSATHIDAVAESQKCACFSEVPLGQLDRLVRRRSRYGIGFHQDFLIRAGGGRVWYLPDASPQLAAFREVVQRDMRGGVDPDDAIWRLTPFVDRVSAEYAFEWEREWRVPTGLAFEPADVAFIFVPEERHGAARAFFWDGNEGAGPAYRCPILDPLWPDDRFQEALAGLSI
jgi:hypothetical protein